jgi:precorrin-2 methylase
MTTRKEEPAVYLVGLGIPELTSMTMEAAAALKKCGIIFTIGAGRYRSGFLELFCPDVRMLSVNNAKANQDREVRAKVQEIFRALKGRSPVAFVTFGHPMFYDTHCRWIRQGCVSRKLPYAVISAVSAFDAVFSALRIDITAGSGVQAGDIDFFSRNAANTAMYVLVFRPHSNLEKLKVFLNKCLATYPPSHRAAFVRCRIADEPEKVTWRKLGDCAAKARELTPWTSILIPPLPAKRKK